MSRAFNFPTFNLPTFNFQPSTFNLQPSTFNFRPSTFRRFDVSTFYRHTISKRALALCRPLEIKPVYRFRVG
jgi:hypothetical protein